MTGKKTSQKISNKVKKSGPKKKKSRDKNKKNENLI